MIKQSENTNQTLNNKLECFSYLCWCGIKSIHLHTTCCVPGSKYLDMYCRCEPKCIRVVKHLFVPTACYLPKPPSHSNGKTAEPSPNSLGSINSPVQLPTLQPVSLFPTTFSKRKGKAFTLRKETESRDRELDVAHLICNLSQHFSKHVPDK